MTMLTHTPGPFERAPYSSERRDTVGRGPTEAHKAMIKEFCMCALTILLAGAALAGIIALRAIAVFHSLNINMH
jgi:hypothetical protein